MFFYKKVNLADTFETRIYLMFIHFSIFLIITKQKNYKFKQDIYDFLFHDIENNLRELGFGDVTVNKKMKEINKILYDILIKLNNEKESSNSFKTNDFLLKKYFNQSKNAKIALLADYFNGFFNFCFELPVDNMLKESIKFEY